MIVASLNSNASVDSNQNRILCPASKISVSLSNWSTRPGGFNGSVGGTNPHELHRKRRAALNPFFSKASIRKLQHEIDEKAIQLVQRLRNEKERVFKVNHAYAALTNG